jgi:hypothetical protein
MADLGPPYVSGIRMGIASSTLTGMDTATKIRENRLRRMAARQRAELIKSRRRDPLAWDYGRYWVLVTGSHVVGGNLVGDYPGLDLDDVEAYLTGSTP